MKKLKKDLIEILMKGEYNKSSFRRAVEIAYMSEGVTKYIKENTTIVFRITLINLTSSISCFWKTFIMTITSNVQIIRMASILTFLFIDSITGVILALWSISCRKLNNRDINKDETVEYNANKAMRTWTIELLRLAMKSSSPIEDRNATTIDIAT